MVLYSNQSALQSARFVGSAIGVYLFAVLSVKF